MDSELMTGAYLDTDMPDGLVRFEGGWDLFMSHRTFMEMHESRRYGDLASAIRALGPGTHRVPDVLMVPTFYAEDATAEAREVALGLSLSDRGPSEVCAYPPCLQPALLDWDGYMVCTGHELTLQGA